MKCVILICILLNVSTQIIGQQDSTMLFEAIELDSSALIGTTLKEDTSKAHFSLQSIFAADPHFPKKAALFSAVLPGLGQAYNRKYWKIPIVYAALGAGGYVIYDNYTFYNRLVDAYLIRTDGDSTTLDEFPFASEPFLLSNLEQYRKWLDLSIVITSALYLLNIIDAVVDAHLYDFDMSDDLSLSVKPILFNQTNGSQLMARNNTTFGISLKLQFK